VWRSGFILLWTFLDKSFGLGYATPSDRVRTHGGWTTWFLIRADQSPHGLKAADNVDSGCPAQAVLVMANHP
jgi:hypothetical protein